MPESDSHCRTPASPSHTPRATSKSTGIHFDEVVDVIEDELVDHVIVGLPLLLSGEEGKSAKKARRWTVNLERRLRAAVEDDEYSLTQVPTIELVDERLTTVTAHHQLFDAQIGGHEHRPMVDQQSAVVILQTAIDRRKR